MNFSHCHIIKKYKQYSTDSDIKNYLYNKMKINERNFKNNAPVSKQKMKYLNDNNAVYEIYK